jgi:hypothetical protein
MKNFLFKKIVVLTIAICSGLMVSAQRSPIPNFSYQDLRPYNFGFLLGANHMDFRVKMKDDFANDRLLGVQSEGTIGFTVGAIANKKLHEYFDLHSGIYFSFGARNLIYTLRGSPNALDDDLSRFEEPVSANQFFHLKKTIESTTLDIPLEVKWRGMRDRSLRPYVIGGFRYSLDMVSNAKKKTSPDDDLDAIVKLHRDDFLFTTGVGFDFYLSHGNRIGVEIKMAFGMRDLLVRENNVFTDGIARLTSRNLQIAINIH